MGPTEHPRTPPEDDSRPRWSVVLRAVREARGLTLEGWAGRLGVSRATVQRWERGERAPDPGAEAAILTYCRDMGLFRSYDRGPLAGLGLTAELLQDLLAEARWRVRGASAGAAPSAEPSPVQHAAATSYNEGRVLSNLSAQLTSFIGREREIAEARRAQVGTRLLTLTGAGGCGKTRLALALADELRWAYPHGVWWVDFAPLPSVGSEEGLVQTPQTFQNPALLPQAVASALMVRSSGQQSLTEALVNALRERHLLLVLDNCEHLLPACAELIDTLLRSRPHLDVMTTSREALGIGGETVWRVPPLSLPVRSDGGGDSDAVRLFVARALLQRPELVLTSDEEEAVAEICRRLDGMPLAIELAAARVKVLSIGQIAARLHDRFRLLTSGGRTVLPRHQTLRAAMDWSYELLTEPEQAVLRALAVFAGGFTLEAAEAGCGDRDQGTGAKEQGGAASSVPSSDVLDLLARLVDKSLVIADVHGGAVRYRMLETVRQYASERLAAAGDEHAARDRHAAWCLTLAGAALPHRTEPDQGVWLERLTIEHDNLRAALGWYLADEREIVAGVRLGGLLWWFWEVRGYLSEGRRWLAALLAGSGDAPAAVRADALEGAGVLAFAQGEFEEATRLHEQSLGLRRSSGDMAGAANSLNHLGIIANSSNDLTRARALFEEYLMIGQELEDPRRVAAALNNLGIVARQAGEPDQAVAHYKEALAVAREMGDTRRVAMSLLNLGHAQRDQGEIERAAARYRESLSMFLDLEGRQDIARCLQGLAAVAAARGEMARAARLAGAAAALREAIGVQLPAWGRAKFEETLAAAREALGEAGFTAAWETGQALSLEDAVAEALSDLG